MYYHWHSPSGKNSRLFFWLRNLLRMATPRPVTRRRLRPVLATLGHRHDRCHILDRLDYYNKLANVNPLPENTPRLRDMKLSDGRSMYFLDAYECTRWFERELRMIWKFGDITQVHEFPRIVKSRPISGDNANSVLLNLDKARHFNFLKDKNKFTDKLDKFIFRGEIARKFNRIAFMEKFHGHPMSDTGIISPGPEYSAEWAKKPISLWKHLNYKFIMALEGNDVASNLKWIMSSNSVAVMPRPNYETWFMEGRLIPNHHYIEIESDFSDLEERLNYYIAHPWQAEAISHNAHRYIAQFLDPQRERLISLLVLQKYFRMTGQL